MAMNTQELKAKVLDLAIRGKLIDSSKFTGETGYELVARIKAERDKLIKDKMIKKKKAFNPIAEDEILFDIPESWVWVRLNDISANANYSFADGPFGSDLKKEHYTSDGVRIIQLSNIGEGVWKDGNEKYTSSEKADDLVRCNCYPDDLVIAKMMPSGRTCMVPNINARYVLASDSVKFRPYEDIDKDNILYFMNSPVMRENIYSKTTGTTRKRTSLGKLQSQVFPLAPCNEQKEIVKQIKELFKIIDNLSEEAESQLATLDQLRQKTLDLAIKGKLVPQDPNDTPASELLKEIEAERDQLIKEKKIKKPKVLDPIAEDEIPFEIPDSWEWIRLNDIVEINPRNHIEDDIEVSFVPMTLMNDGYGDSYNSESRLWTDVKKGYTHFADGDIAVSKISPCFENRKSAIFRNLQSGYGAGTTEFHIFRCYNEKLCKDYFLRFFKSQWLIDLGSQTFTGSVGQQRVKTTFVEKLTFPLPPANEQIRIVEKVDEVMQLIDQMENELKRKIDVIEKLQSA